MRNDHTIAVVIPALDEAASIGKVIADIPSWVDDIIVVDNGSVDDTVSVATNAGARVVHEPRRGYGQACLAGVAALGGPDIVAFLDGDYSDHPGEMGSLVDPILLGQADMVIGSRVLGKHDPGALTPRAQFGNWLTVGPWRTTLLNQAIVVGHFLGISPARLAGWYRGRETCESPAVDGPNAGIRGHPWIDDGQTRL